MLTVSVNKYKKLLKSLNEKISLESLKFCHSEEFGYCSNRGELLRLTFIKELLINNFIRKKLDKNFYCVEIFDDVTITKSLNKIIGDKVELIVKKVKKTVKTDKSFKWSFPELPQPNGVWVGDYFVPVPVNSLSDIENVKIYLENKKLFSFFAFTVDYGKKTINSCKYTTEEIEICNEYQDLDKYCAKCLDEIKLKKLIEDVCRL